MYVENLDVKSLTSMTVYAGRTVATMTVHRGTFGKKIETLRRRVSDRHDGYAGRNVEGMMIRRRCPSEDTWKNYGDP